MAAKHAAPLAVERELGHDRPGRRALVRLRTRWNSLRRQRIRGVRCGHFGVRAARGVGGLRGSGRARDPGPRRQDPASQRDGPLAGPRRPVGRAAGGRHDTGRQDAGRGPQRARRREHAVRRSGGLDGPRRRRGRRHRFGAADRNRGGTRLRHRASRAAALAARRLRRPARRAAGSAPPGRIRCRRARPPVVRGVPGGRDRAAGRARRTCGMGAGSLDRRRRHVRSRACRAGRRHPDRRGPRRRRPDRGVRHHHDRPPRPDRRAARVHPGRSPPGRARRRRPNAREPASSGRGLTTAAADLTRRTGPS